MYELVLETISAVIAIIITSFIFGFGVKYQWNKLPGWSFVIWGLCLLCLGMMFEVVGNFDPLTSYLIFGNNQLDMLLDVVGGHLLGISFIIVGLMRLFCSLSKDQEINLPGLLCPVYDNFSRSEHRVAPDDVVSLCAFCKKVRDDDGAWQSLEDYLKDMSGSPVSHGVCPQCAKDQYPEIRNKTANH